VNEVKAISTIGERVCGCSTGAGFAFGLLGLDGIVACNGDRFASVLFAILGKVSRNF
jgi:hypothetical protein